MSQGDLHKIDCLLFLDTSGTSRNGYSTREVAEHLKVSVYQARILLLALQSSGLVKPLPRKKEGRGVALYWRRT